MNKTISIWVIVIDPDDVVFAGFDEETAQQVLDKINGYPPDIYDVDEELDLWAWDEDESYYAPELTEVEIPTIDLLKYLHLDR